MQLRFTCFISTRLIEHMTRKKVEVTASVRVTQSMSDTVNDAFPAV